MKVLVTGSTGFIGAALCRALVELGHTVRAFHRPSSSMRLISDLPVQHALGDLTHPDTLVEAMKDIEAVFHVAAHLGGAIENPGLMYAVTVEGTRSILKAARQCGVRRVVYTSSVAALGVPEAPPTPTAPAVLLDEHHTWNYEPQYWNYGYSKYLAELEVQRAVSQGLDAVIVNPTYVIGAGDIYRQSSSIVMQVARRRLPFVVKGGINVVHIADVVSGHVAALERGKTGQRYILGGENLTYVDLVRQIAAAAHVRPPLAVAPSHFLRSVSGLLGLFKTFISMPVPSSMLRLAGAHFYYDNRKSLIELQLPISLPASEAIYSAYEWFNQHE